MTKQTQIEVQFTLFDEIAVGPNNCPADMLLFRAPVVRDGSGTYKRLPHQVDWCHLQEGDAVMAIHTSEGPSGQRVLDVLQFWRVIRRDEDGESVWVSANNITGMAGDGEYVYGQMAKLVGLPETEL